MSKEEIQEEVHHEKLKWTGTMDACVVEPFEGGKKSGR